MAESEVYKKIKSIEDDDAPPESNSKRQPLEGGFEVEFVDPPKELQSECPICLQVLSEPYQATCCGNSFCKSCIERQKNNNGLCPTCNQDDYNIFPDKRLQRSLYEFRVRCSHSGEGCTWEGELGELSRHLNSKPSPDSRLTGCEFEKIKCKTCEDLLYRKDLQTHEVYHCDMRPYTCDYCHSYKSNCTDVTVNHWPVCPCRPTLCPNECGVYPEKQHMEQHLSSECVKRKKSCPFEYAGCSVSVHENEIDQHLKDNFYEHMYLMTASESKMEKKMNDFKTAFEEEKTASRDQVQDLMKRVHELESEVNRLTIKQENDRKSIQSLQSHSAIVPVVFVLDDFRDRLKDKDMGWTPRPFYTHSQGYKLLMCVDVYGNGSGKGSHMSIFLSLLKGEFDEYLKWPLCASVTVRLQNQVDDESHYEEVIKYNKSTPILTAGRVMEEGQQGRPWGKGKFIAHSDLTPKFLKDDSIILCISKVDLY